MKKEFEKAAVATFRMPMATLKKDKILFALLSNLSKYLCEKLDKKQGHFKTEKFLKDQMVSNYFIDMRRDIIMKNYSAILMFLWRCLKIHRGIK